jgi:hypothetical protein
VYSSLASVYATTEERAGLLALGSLVTPCGLGAYLAVGCLALTVIAGVPRAKGRLRSATHTRHDMSAAPETSPG